MSNSVFMKVDEVAEELGISESYAYKVIRGLNEELDAKGFLTVSGRISRQYFYERIYGGERKLNNASVQK
ncbi:MAG: LysR family transcriptional regulator [Firmicutes bacterium]|nr:LysR family transcriptional regulator [Bacillota bacterium]MCD7805361.1 LysR family transcriptional regulator [Oscillospiraceae bacterium]MCD7822470.1 LysR family transcriptional regulator [Oscillospiraceae bacterium]